MKQSGKDSIQIALFGDKPVYYNPKFKQEEDEKADEHTPEELEEALRYQLLRLEAFQKISNIFCRISHHLNI